MYPKIKTAIIPCAGLGTRLLPATKVVPKELLPVYDRPVIEHVVAEGLAAGIERFVLVTNQDKSAIAEHFRSQPQLEDHLAARGKRDALNAVRACRLPPNALIEVFQHEPLGLGHAVLQAARTLDADERSVAVILPDDLYLSLGASKLPMVQMVDHHARTGEQVLAGLEVPANQLSSYGVAAFDEKIQPLAGGRRLTGIVEKPAPGTAPSSLALMGRYILHRQIFDQLRTTAPGAGGEIQLTDGIAASLRQHPTTALPILAERYDCGDRDGWVAAQSAAQRFTQLRQQLKEAAIAV